MIVLVSLLGLLGCFSKKSKKENLESWLDKNFPGQFEILDSRHRFMEKFQLSNKVTSVVASRQDTDVQFVVLWYKKTEGLLVTKEEIQEKFETSIKEVAQSRHLLSDLNAGESHRIAISVLQDAAYFLVYDDPIPANRKKTLEVILDLLSRQKDLAQTNIFIEFMEDSTYHHEFKDIVPAGYWNRIDSYHEQNKIVSIDFTWKPALKIDDLMTGWAVNTASARSGLFREDAFSKASAWAEKHLKAPYYLEPVQYVQYEPDAEDLMAIRFHFPYYAEQPPQDSLDLDHLRLGYVSGIYQVDHKTFSNIEKEAEL